MRTIDKGLAAVVLIFMVLRLVTFELVGFYLPPLVVRWRV